MWVYKNTFKLRNEGGPGGGGGNMFFQTTFCVNIESNLANIESSDI